MAGMGFWNKMMTKGGNRAGQAVGAGLGAAQLIGANKLRKKADAAMPSPVDQNQASFLVELQQKKNALNTGSEYTSSLDAINDKMAQTQDVLAGNSGGDAGGTISALLKSQQVANQGQGQLLAQGQQQEGMYTGLYGNLLDKIAQRKMELGLINRDQAMAEWAQKKQAGMANFMTGAQNFMNWKGGDKEAQAPMGAGGGGTGGATSSTGGAIGNSPGSARQGIEGFNIGGGGSQAPTFGGGNPGASQLVKNMGTKDQGLNFDTSKMGGKSGGGMFGGKGGGGFDFSKMLSGFGK